MTAEMAIAMNLTPEQVAKIERIAMDVAAVTGESKERVISQVVAAISQQASQTAKPEHLTSLAFRPKL